MTSAHDLVGTTFRPAHAEGQRPGAGELAAHPPLPPDPFPHPRGRRGRQAFRPVRDPRCRAHARPLQGRGIHPGRLLQEEAPRSPGDRAQPLVDPVQDLFRGRDRPARCHVRPGVRPARLPELLPPDESAASRQPRGHPGTPGQGSPDRGGRRRPLPHQEHRRDPLRQRPRRRSEASPARRFASSSTGETIASPRSRSTPAPRATRSASRRRSATSTTRSRRPSGSARRCGRPSACTPSWPSANWSPTP